jgi:PLD-like domain
VEKVLFDGQQCKVEILSAFANAKEEILVAMAYFTDKDIAERLIQLSQSGIKVLILVSSDQINAGILELLEVHNIIKVVTKPGGGVMHHKFAIIDSRTLMHGTYNYTYNAANKNDEELVISDSAVKVNAFISQFKELYTTVLGSNETEQKIKIEMSTINSDNNNVNYITDFTRELEEHVSNAFDDFNHDGVKNDGIRLSEESNGAEAVFRNYLTNALNEVRAKVNIDEHSKALVKTRINATYERVLESFDLELHAKLKLLNQDYSVQKSQKAIAIAQKNERIDTIENDKQVLNNERSSILFTIKETKDEIDDIDRRVIVRKFWTLPNWLKIGVLLIIFPYLSLFFASSLWKIFFEKNKITALIERGVVPAVPPLFDANALSEIYSTNGVFYGLFASIFFLFPVLLSNIKLLNKNQYVELFIGWFVGLFLVDIIVSLLISQHAFEIKQLLNGSDEKWRILAAMQTPDFWLIFIFGALPLFLSKMFVESLAQAYNESSLELVDREKYQILQAARRRFSEFELALEQNSSKIAVKDSEIQANHNDISSLVSLIVQIEAEENKDMLSIKDSFDKKVTNIRNIYNSFVSSVDSGSRIILKTAVSQRVSAFKGGFYLHLTRYFAPDVARDKTTRLEESYQNWIIENFQN